MEPVKKKEVKPKIEEKKAPKEPKIATEVTKEHKVSPEPKADVKEEIQREKARTEEKKIKKGGFLKNIRRYFRGKAP